MPPKNVMRGYLNFGKLTWKSQVFTKWYKTLKSNTIYKMLIQVNSIKCWNLFKVQIIWVSKWCWLSLIHLPLVELLSIQLIQSTKLAIFNSNKVIKCSKIIMEPTFIDLHLEENKMFNRAKNNQIVRDGHLDLKKIILKYSKFIINKCRKLYRIIWQKENL